MESIDNKELELSDLINKYNEIRYNLLNIINVYDDIIVNCSGKIKECDPVRELLKRKYYYEIHFNTIQKTIDELKETIYNNCQHEFVTDYIDTGIDTTQKITYCSICEYTKH